MKKILSFVLIFATLFSVIMIAPSASAANDNKYTLTTTNMQYNVAPNTTIVCNSNYWISYNLYDNGTLIQSGESTSSNGYISISFSMSRKQW